MRSSGWNPVSGAEPEEGGGGRALCGLNHKSVLFPGVHEESGGIGEGGLA